MQVLAYDGLIYSGKRKSPLKLKKIKNISTGKIKKPYYVCKYYVPSCSFGNICPRPEVVKQDMEQF